VAKESIILGILAVAIKRAGDAPVDYQASLKVSKILKEDRMEEKEFKSSCLLN